MKSLIRFLLFLFIVINSVFSSAQEWKSLRYYQKKTGNNSLSEGYWLKKDRKHETEVWEQAILFNLALEDGNKKYTTICQIRDFYTFFNKEIKKQGHEIKWVGIAAKAASQLSQIETGVIRVLIVRDKKLAKFAHNGALKVFEFAFAQFREVYFSSNMIVGEAAILWDKKYGKIEQCEILEPLYAQLPEKTVHKLARMAKGKGVYNLVVPKKLKFVGEITNCQTRYEHGRDRLAPFCDSKEYNR